MGGSDVVGAEEHKVVIFGGGIPIREDGIVIGAVGASSGSVDQDVIVARAALAGLSDQD
ncbi:MAG: heme-binding protein [Gammaproteobacteria bacterium]|nr:MAG: heme-binding protein [Gammaproteobacteria bacterium]